MPWKSLVQKRGNVCPITENKRKAPCGTAYQDRYANKYEGVDSYDTEYSSAYGRNYPTPQQHAQQQEQQYRFQSLEHYMSEGQGRCDQLCHQQQFSYDPHMQEQCRWSQRLAAQRPQNQQKTRTTQQPQNFQLYNQTPAPITDKHYRGAHYQPGHALGVQVPEEISRIRETSQGPVRLSLEEDLFNCYLPLYKYRDWVERSEIDVWHDCNTSSLKCRMPEAPTEHWDFYNEVRMNRPAKKLHAPTYGTCRVLPIPLDKNLENIHEFDCYDGQCSNMQNQRFQGQAYMMANMCRC